VAFTGGWDDTHYVAVAWTLCLLFPLLGSLPFPARLGWLARVGIFSYSVYLIHVPVGIYGFMRLLPDKFTSNLAFIGGQLLLLAAILPAAWLFHRLAERPFLPPLLPARPVTA
jgi:peptidoglycan/LPS O-acetylase OafA/YrhL